MSLRERITSTIWCILAFLVGIGILGAWGAQVGLWQCVGTLAAAVALNVLILYSIGEFDEVPEDTIEPCTRNHVQYVDRR